MSAAPDIIETSEADRTHSAEQMVTDTYLTFDIAGQTFAVDVCFVREILDMQAILQLPNAPGDLMGVIDVRGQAISVVDLASRLALARSGGEGERIIVFEFGKGLEQTPIGVIADRVLSVAEVDDSSIEPTPATMSAWDPAAVRGVTRINGEIIILLHLSEIFDSEPGVDPAFAF